MEIVRYPHLTLTLLLRIWKWESQPGLLKITLARSVHNCLKGEVQIVAAEKSILSFFESSRKVMHEKKESRKELTLIRKKD
jgi:hypothetical protein